MITQNIISINTIFNKNIRKVTELELVKFLESQKGMNPIEAAMTAKQELESIEDKFVSALLKKGISDIKNEIFNVNLENNNINQMIQFNKQNPIKTSMSMIKSSVDVSLYDTYEMINNLNKTQIMLDYTEEAKNSFGALFIKELYNGIINPNHEEKDYAKVDYVKAMKIIKECCKEINKEVKDYLKDEDAITPTKLINGIRQLNNKEIKSMVNFMKMAYEYNHTNKSDSFIKRSKKMFKFLNYNTVDLYKNESGYFLESPQYEYIKSKIGTDFHNMEERQKIKRVGELVNSKEFMKISNNLSQILSYENKCKFEKRNEREELVKKLVEVRILEETEEYKQNLKKLE